MSIDPRKATLLRKIVELFRLDGVDLDWTWYFQAVVQRECTAEDRGAKSWVGHHCYAVWSFRRPMSARSIQLNVRRSWGTQGWTKGRKIGRTPPFRMTLIVKIAWNTRWDGSIYMLQSWNTKRRDSFCVNLKKFETILEVQITSVATQKKLCIDHSKTISCVKTRSW